MAGGMSDAFWDAFWAEVGKCDVTIRPWDDADTPPPSTHVFSEGGTDYWGTVTWCQEAGGEDAPGTGLVPDLARAWRPKVGRLVSFSGTE